MLSEINEIYKLTIWLFHWSNLTELETFYLTQKYFLLWRCEIFCKYCNKFVLCTDKYRAQKMYALTNFLTPLFVSQRRSHMQHIDIDFLHVQIVYVYLRLLFVMQRSYIDISSLHAQIIYVSIGFLFESQWSHMFHMDISSLHAQIVYVFLGLLFVL